jgi:cytidylate kinase
LSALEHVLWIGGGQWAGKTSIARLLVERYGLQLYDYDYHDARSHSARAKEHPDRYPHIWAAHSRTPDQSWVLRSPEEMARTTLLHFEERFAMLLEDLQEMLAAPPVLVEGWGIRPRMVAPLLKSKRQAIWLVATEGFRRHQMEVMPRAQRLSVETSDPDRAQRKRLERDRLLGRDVIDSARRLRLKVLVVDGKKSLEAVAALVESHFQPFLPKP